MTRQELLHQMALLIDKYEHARGNMVCLGVYVDLEDKPEIIYEWNGQEFVPTTDIKIGKKSIHSASCRVCKHLLEPCTICGKSSFCLNCSTWKCSCHTI